MTAFLSLVCLLAALLFSSPRVGAFVSRLPLLTQTRTRLWNNKGLDAASIEKLDEMRNKYNRLQNVVSEDAEKERAELQQTVEKYKTYVDIKIMMGKVRMMWKSEASEARKDRQLKSFLQLYSGKLELEEILKAKLGLPHSKEIPKLPFVEEISKFNKDIAALEKKLEEVKIVIPEGMSTRDERFYGAPQS